MANKCLFKALYFSSECLWARQHSGYNTTKWEKKQEIALKLLPKLPKTSHYYKVEKRPSKKYYISPKVAYTEKKMISPYTTDNILDAEEDGVTLPIINIMGNTNTYHTNDETGIDIDIQIKAE